MSDDILDILLAQRKNKRGLKESHKPVEVARAPRDFEDAIGVIVRAKGKKPNRARLGKNGKPNGMVALASDTEVKIRRREVYAGDELDGLTQCSPTANEATLGNM